MSRTTGALPRALTALLAAVLSGVVLAGPAQAQETTPAPAVSGAPSDATPDAVARLAELDAETTALADEVDASLATLAERRTALEAASTAADGAAAEASVARVEAEIVRKRVDDLVAAGYAGARTSRLSAVLVAESPQELLDRMTVLDVLGSDSALALQAATDARAEAAVASTAADAARDAAAAAQAEAQQTQDGLVSRRDALATRTAEATALLATLSARADVAADVLAPSRVAEQERASRAGGVRSALVVRPAVGRFTSGYGSRNGSAHNGIDIANTIGTPIVAAADGVVLVAGPASGFGLWVRVQHADGTITTYGHNNTNVVATGQRVSAGQQIATIGNRGQSTGPHLHFEVELPGGGTVDPRGWLTSNGVSV